MEVWLVPRLLNHYMEPSGHPRALAAVKSLRTLLNTNLFGHRSWCDRFGENNFNTAEWNQDF
jgi:hypothetical protein